MEHKKVKLNKNKIGKIPEDWTEHSLYGVVYIIGGGTPKTSVPEYWGGDIPWISVVDFVGDRRWIYDTEKHITQEGLKNSSTKLLKKDQIIISARGTVGEIGQLSREMAFNQSCYGLNAKEKLTNDFLYYLLKFNINKIRNVGHGAVFNTITTDTFKNIFVLLPPLSEQKAIAKILSDLDAKIELNNKMNKTLEEIGQALFKKWFIDERKDDWKMSKIGKELKTILGGTPDRTNPIFWNGNINWINSGKVNEFRIMEPSEKITISGMNNSAAKLLPKGTTVLAITGATLGQVSRLEIDSCANQSVIGIIESERIKSEYIYYWIKNEIKEIISHQTGGAQQHINKNNVDNYELLIPNKETLDNFNEVIKPIFNQISLNCFQNQRLSQIRDSLLPKLMNGEIRVK